MAGSASTRHTARRLRFIRWRKDSIFGVQPERLGNYGNGVRHWLQWERKPQRASACTRSSEEQGPSLQSDTGARATSRAAAPATAPQEGPRATRPSSGESVCLHLENTCFSISAIYIFYVQNIFIINIFIMAHNALHSTTYLGYVYQWPFISRQHIGWKRWSLIRGPGKMIFEKTELWIVLVLVHLNYLNWHLFFFLQSYSSKVQFLF